MRKALFIAIQNSKSEAPFIDSINIVNDSGTLRATYVYDDNQDDLEDNPLCQITNIVITGDFELDGVLTVTFDFSSPSKYSQNTTSYQWYRQEDDGSNKVAISGATNNTYTVVADDVEKSVSCIITVTQTATVPANGNPTSLPTESARYHIDSVEQFSPLTHYHHYFKAASWNDTNKEAPDEGLSGGSGFFVAPVGNEPTYQANGGQPYLDFDPASSGDFLNFTITATSDGHFEVIGRAKWDTLTSIRTLYGFASTVDFRNNTASPQKWQARDSQTVTSTANADTTEHSFRLVFTRNGTNATLRLQIDKNTGAQTYAVDETLVFSNNGANLTNTTVKLGASFAGTNFFDGYIKEFGVYINGSLDHTAGVPTFNSELVDAMWDYLNSL